MLHEPDAWTGHVIDGRFRLDARIAEGGFGTVYRGWHLGFGRPVAIKLLRVERPVADLLGPERSRLVDDLRTEGATLQRVSAVAPGVVQALDVGEAFAPDGQWAPYLVLEWVDGEPLDRVVSTRGPMALDEAVILLDPVASALDAAHGLGIAHRDVKPGNVLVARDGTLPRSKLLDFGVAKVMASDALARARAATRLSFLAFTPAWGAPEQFDPSLGHTGPWTDVHALALVLVYVLTGKRPYGDDAADLIARVMDRSLRPTPRALGLELGDEVEHTFARALAFDPRNRPARAGELWTALVRAVDATRRADPHRASLPVSSASAPRTLVTGGTTLEDRRSSAGAPAVNPLLHGRPLGGDFVLVRELSRGGMGAVYAAQQLSTGKTRAVKLMHPSLTANERLRARFEQEARVAAHVASEHVVDVIGAGVDVESGVPWLAMELLEGEDLASHVARRGPLSPAEVLAIFEQLCHAVGAAHRAGIVHRDLKPENVFLVPGRRADAPFTIKVLDFGIAKVVAEANEATTASVGTPLWMAPEQADASAPIGAPADVWALGLIAFWLLTGASYWQTGNEAAPSSTRILSEVLFGPLPRASERAHAIRPGVLSPAFDEWFSRCVARDPRTRFADADQALQALRTVLGDAAAAAAAPARWKAPTEPMGVAALPAAPTEPMPQTTSSQAWIAPPPPPVVPPSGGARSRRGPLGALLVAGVALLAGGLVFLAVRDGDEPNDASAPSHPPPKAKEPSTAAKKTDPAGAFDVEAAAAVGGGRIRSFRLGAVQSEASYLSAAKYCLDREQVLCSEVQWATACDRHADVAKIAVLTSTWGGDGWVLAGGGTCSQREEVRGDTEHAYRCCSPALAMRGFDVEDAARYEKVILEQQDAVNAARASDLAALFHSFVERYYTLENTTPKAVEAAAAYWLKQWPDQWNMHESCRATDDVSGHVSAVCRKHAQWGGKVVVTDTIYRWRDGKYVFVDDVVVRKREAP